jgi:hypothetical protein
MAEDGATESLQLLSDHITTFYDEAISDEAIELYHELQSTGSVNWLPR